MIDLALLHTDSGPAILVADYYDESAYGSLWHCERQSGPTYQVALYDATQGHTKPECITFHAGVWALHRAWMSATGGLELDVSMLGEST